MILVNDQKKLSSYIKKFNLNSLFENDIRKYMNLYSLQKNEFNCQNTDDLNYMFFLVSGRIKIYKLLDNGKLLLIRFNEPLSIIGDIEYISNYPVKTNVETQDPSELIGISFTELNKYCCNDSKFLKFLAQNLSYKLYTFTNSACINLMYPLETRFACYLLSLCKQTNNAELIKHIKIGKLNEIAMLLGTTYRHLHRTIKTLSQKQIICANKGLVIVLDYDKLQELAKENIYE